MLTNKHLGKFFIKKDYINTKLEAVREVLSHMVIIEARYSQERDVFDYVAICPLFDEVQEKEVVPSYQLSFDNVAGKKKLVVKKIEK